MTTKQLIRQHNELAADRGLPPLNGWKASKEALQARIDGLRTQQPADPLAIPEAFGDAETDQVPPDGAEATTDEHVEPTVHPEASAECAEAPAKSGRGGIGKLVASLLLDAEGFDYPTIVEMVAGEFPDAQTSTRSVASVAARLRKDGVEVPMRRQPRRA